MYTDQDAYEATLAAEEAQAFKDGSDWQYAAELDSAERAQELADSERDGFEDTRFGELS